MAKKAVAKTNLKNNVNNKPSNAWKIVSIVFIILFLLVLAGALVRVYHFRPPITRLTAEQALIAKNISMSDLTSKGEDPSRYAIRVSDIRPINIGAASRNITEVSLYNDTVKHLYIIDIDQGTILLYSKTESYGFINFSDDKFHFENSEWTPRPRMGPPPAAP